MDIWSWMCELQNSTEWMESNSPLFFELASTTLKSKKSDEACSLRLKAERASAGSMSDTSVIFTVCLHGFQFNTGATAKNGNDIWVSESCQLSAEKPFLPLVLQLLQETISRAPTAQNSTCPRSQLQSLKPEPIAWVMDSHSPESFSRFFNLVFITRLFWLCACDAPSEVGPLYFQSLLAPNLETLFSKHTPVLRTFFLAVGVDVEQCFLRTVGYMLTKWCILKEVAGVGLQSIAATATAPSEKLGFAYATESHGFWILKGYAPVMTMKMARTPICQKSQFGVVDTKESILKYALAHQQLEAVVQFEYTIGFYEGFIQVHARLDNIRLHVTRLGFNNNDDVEFANERHFPSRVRVWVGPEVGANYVDGLSLGRSTSNEEREVEVHKTLKGSFGKSDAVSNVRAVGSASTRSKVKNWRMDQDADGNAAIFDVVLYDTKTGKEVASWKPPAGDENQKKATTRNHDFRGRVNGVNRVCTKNGGVVFAGDKYGEEVGWKLSKEMEGSVLKWRIGGKAWLSYFPNEVESSYFETRYVEWCDEVDLPLIPRKFAMC